MHIVVADELSPSAIAVLQDQGWSVDATSGRAPARLAQDLAHADALIVRSATRVTADVIAGATQLRVIARAGAGVDNIDLAAAAARGIPVLNAPGATTNSVAELTLALVLALARQVPAADRSMKAGKWEKKAFAGSELAQKTLGLVGYGRIGHAVARLARAFGMQVVVHDPAGSAADAAAEGVRLATLDEVCAAADYLSLHLPSSPATRHLIGADRLRRCKRGVRIVNTARGELVDEAALVEALTSGQVSGAALDVYAVEPPGTSALVSHPAVIAMPHVGASTPEAQDRVGVEIAETVRDYLRDGTLRNAVTRT